MKIRISELSGAQVDKLVAKVENLDLDAEGVAISQDGTPIIFLHEAKRYLYSPSTLWVDGGPIFYWEQIDLHFLNATVQATMRDSLIFDAEGQTPLEAAMCCYAVCKSGERDDELNGRQRLSQLSDTGKQRLLPGHICIRQPTM